MSDMSDIYGGLFGSLFGMGSTTPPEPQKEYLGKVIEVEVGDEIYRYQLIRMEENFMGTWYAIPTGGLPAAVTLVHHAPTRRWQEDKQEAEHRENILRHMHIKYSRDGEPGDCQKGCAYQDRHSYKLHRPEGVDEWPSLYSQLCQGHQARLRATMEANPTWRLPKQPGDPRVVADGEPEVPEEPDRLSLLLGEDE